MAKKHKVNKQTSKDPPPSSTPHILTYPAPDTRRLSARLQAKSDDVLTMLSDSATPGTTTSASADHPHPATTLADSPRADDAAAANSTVSVEPNIIYIQCRREDATVAIRRLVEERPDLVDRDDVQVELQFIEPDGFIPEHLLSVYEPPEKVLPTEAISGTLSVPPSPAKSPSGEATAAKLAGSAQVEHNPEPVNITKLTPDGIPAPSTPVATSRKRLRIELSPSNDDAGTSVVATKLPVAMQPFDDNPFIITPASGATHGPSAVQAGPMLPSFARTGSTPINDVTAHFNPVNPATNFFVNTIVQTIAYMQILRCLLPPVHDGRPYRLFAHMRGPQILDWWNERTDSLIIQVFGTNAWNVDTPYVLTLLTEALQGVVGLTNPLIAAPNPLADPRSYRPSSFLLLNPPRAIYDRLVEQFCWSTTEIAFFAYKMSFTLPRFIGSFNGFTTSDKSTIAKAFRAHIDCESSRIIIDQLREDHPGLNFLPLEDIVTAILDSIEVQVLIIEEKGKPRISVANLYIDSPTDRADQWLLWQSYLREIVYTTQFHGNGIKREMWKCSGCHGDDHPRGLCPFPKLTGWMTRPFRFNNPVIDINNPSGMNNQSGRPATPANGPSAGGSSRGNYRGNRV